MHLNHIAIYCCLIFETGSGALSVKGSGLETQGRYLKDPEKAGCSGVYAVHCVPFFVFATTGGYWGSQKVKQT